MKSMISTRIALVVAAAVATTVALDAQAGGKKFRWLKHTPVVQCIEPDQGPEPNILPPAYTLSFQLPDLTQVRYTIDNQFAQINQNRNLPRFYGTPINEWVIAGAEADCSEDYGVKCTLVNIDQMNPAPVFGSTPLPLIPEEVQ